MLIGLILVACVGLCVGSFANVVILRLRLQDQARAAGLLTKNSAQPGRGHAAPSTKELSISRGRSVCPHCHHFLPVGDLIPVFSWLRLGGHCRFCKASISFQYPLVELLTAVLFGLSFAAWPQGNSTTWLVISLVAWLVICFLFVVLGVYDLRWQELPLEFIWLSYILGLIVVYVQQLTQGESVAATSLWWFSGAAVVAGIFLLLHLVSRGRWLGAGDVWLGALLGLLLGPLLGLVAISVASYIGLAMFATQSFLGAKSLKTDKRRAKAKIESRLAFGPALLLACFGLFLFGQQLRHLFQPLSQ